MRRQCSDELQPYEQVGGRYLGSCGRVVKALDLKSNGLCPRRFEPCQLRQPFTFVCWPRNVFKTDAGEMLEKEERSAAICANSSSALCANAIEGASCPGSQTLNLCKIYFTAICFALFHTLCISIKKLEIRILLKYQSIHHSPPTKCAAVAVPVIFEHLQPSESLATLNHTTVKVVPALNWTAKFPNGKFNPEL